MAALEHDSRTAPRVVILLPIAFLLHVLEEWFSGFPAWTLAALGRELSPERFLLINGTAFPLFAIGTVAAFHSARMAWFGASFATLLGLNGVLHTLATLGLGRYSPGTITGLLLFIPLSVMVLRSSSVRLSRPAFAGSVLVGILLHGLATLLAFR